MIWAVYISDKPYSRVNFLIGMKQGIWGIKDTKKDTITEIKKGDLVAFILAKS